MYAIRSYYGQELGQGLVEDDQLGLLPEPVRLRAGRDQVPLRSGKGQGARITSYNVCYTKLLRPSEATGPVAQVVRAHA